MKTVVVNGLSALQGGGQTYLINLFKYASAFSDLRVVAILPRHASSMFSANGVETVTPEFPAKSILHRVVWEWFTLPKLLKQLNADVLYSPGGMVPLSVKCCKTAVAFRNMLPFSDAERRRFPPGYIRVRLWLLRRLLLSSFRRADLVIFVSAFAKRVIDGLVPGGIGESVLVPHGVTDEFRSQALPRPPGLPEDYVLYVSILDFYKAQLEVIQAWHQVRTRRVTHEKLVLLGSENPSYGSKVRELIRRLGLEEEVLILGNVPYHELPAYYQHAKINIFASSCENCPNILLEALASGRPVLSSNYEPMPEFAQNSVKYFDPYNPQSLTALLLNCLDNSELLAEMGEKALLQSNTFQWETTALMTWGALSQLADKKSCAG